MTIFTLGICADIRVVIDMVAISFSSLISIEVRLFREGGGTTAWCSFHGNQGFVDRNEKKKSIGERLLCLGNVQKAEHK